MPKISVIIPAYNVETYIGRCLDSLVNQTLSEIEVLVVNDGSTDNTEAVVRQYVAAHPDKVRLFTVPNGGAASARNHALPYATGEYIGFVDSDDYVQPTMYEKLYAAATEKEADIVCCAYCRVMTDRINNKGFGNNQIQAAEVFDSNIYNSPLLFDEVPYLWNKIFRTSILRDNGLIFQKDLRIYEDLVFTYTAFMYAQKISRIEDVLYNYIVYRNDSLTFAFSEKRFDLMKAARYLLDAYQRQGVLDEPVRDALLYVILKHMYVILEHPTSPKEKPLKQQYIRQIFPFLDNTFPGWRQNAYFSLQNKPRRLYTSPSHWKRAVMLGRQIRVRSVVRRLGGIAVKGAQFLFGLRSGAAYQAATRQPIRGNRVLLYSQQGKNLHGNMFYLLKAMATHPAYDAYTLYVGVAPESKAAFRALLRNYGLAQRAVLVENDSRRFIRVLATARYLFSDTSLPPYYIKRDGQIYLNTWHGTPLKTLGKATANDFFDIPNVQKSFVLADYLLYPSTYMREIMVEDYMLKGLANNQILMSGYPRNEVFLSGGADAVRTALGLDGKTLYAYMPTWRGGVRDVQAEEQQRQLLEHLTVVDGQLTEREILFVNLHPYVRSAINFGQFAHIRPFPQVYETYDFLNACDLLITDYSSVFFDFAVTRKPIVLFTYDEADYLADRGMYLDMQTLPFPKAMTAEELVAQMRAPVIDPVVYEAFVATYCAYDAPDTSARICRQVVLGENVGLHLEPMPAGERENVLLQVGNFAPSHAVVEFIKAAENTPCPRYNYCFTYISANVRPHISNFKKLVGRLPYYGQMGSLTNTTRLQALVLGGLIRRPQLYQWFGKTIERMLETERKRLYTGLSFKAAVVFNNLSVKRVYEFAHMPCRRILYLSCPQYLNKQVHPEAYRAFDHILVATEETAQAVTAFIGENSRVRVIPPVQDLNDLAEFVD